MPGAALCGSCYARGHEGGGDDHDGVWRIVKIWSENVRRYVRGETLNNLIDKRRGY